MKSILILYASTEGQARKVAVFVDERLKARGFEVDLVEAGSPEAEVIAPTYAAAIVCGSLHQGKFQPVLVRAVQGLAAWLGTIPSMLVAVSLSAAFPEDKHLQADLAVSHEHFQTHTRWTPGIVLDVAGALRYTEYDWLKRFVARLIARDAGAPQDATRDWEFTDWAALSRSVGEFVDAASLTPG